MADEENINILRKAVISGGVVVNIIDAPEDFELDGFTLVASNTAQKGDQYEEGVFTTPETIPGDPPLPVPSVVASGNFTVADWQVDNLSVISGLPAACAVDTGTYWVFFSEVQPDTSYIVSAGSSEGRVNVKARYEEYFEICVKDDGGALINPSEFSVSIVRTQ